MIAERSSYRFPNATDDHDGWLTPTGIADFMRCPRCWEIANVLKAPRPIGIDLPIGRVIHRAIEFARGEHMAQRSVKMGEVREMSGELFDEECSTPADAETGSEVILDLGKHESIGEAKDQALRMVAYFVPELLRLDATRGVVIATEFRLYDLPSPFPFPIHGKVDALYAPRQTAPEFATLMADLKSSGRRPSTKSGKPDEFTAITQTIYEMHWHHRGLPLTALADVAFKGDPPELGVFGLSVDAASRQTVYGEVVAVANDICAGRFPIRPSWACKFSHGLPEFRSTIA